MGDKFDGSLAADIEENPAGVPVTEALASLLLHETLVALDESEKEVHLHAVPNPHAGGLMLVRQPDVSDQARIRQVIWQTQMTSMLSDFARCSKYSTAIAELLKKREVSHVLDIGTGTGLLAAIAAKSGASRVDAVEMFKPMADMAKKIVKQNKYESIVNVIHGRSTDLSVASSSLESEYPVIPRRADALVTEIFDSALLGENCLRVIKHAKEHLLRPGAPVIPAKATVYGAVVSSEFLSRFQSLGKDFPLHRDTSGPSCQGGAIGIPMHFEALGDGRDYAFLTEEFKVFDFDFSKRTIPESSLQRCKTQEIMRTRSGIPHAVVTWWDLDLDDDDIIHSTRMGVERWQDHWLQVVYPVTADNVSLSENSDIILTMRHNELSFSFSLAASSDEDMMNMCRCGLHNIMTPSRIFEVGDSERLEWLRVRIKQALDKIAGIAERNGSTPVRCLDMSDGAVCSALAARETIAGGVEVISVEEDDEVSSFIFDKICHRVKKDGNEVHMHYEALSELIKTEKEAQQKGDWRPFEVLLSEPYTRSMHSYPIYTLGNLTVQRKAMCGLVSENFSMVPGHARIYGQLIRFPRETLQRNFAKITKIQGINHVPYNELLQREKWEQMPRRFSLPLYQYRPIDASDKMCIQTIDLAAKDEEFLKQLDAEANVMEMKVYNNMASRVEAVCFWVEYDGREVGRTERYEIAWLMEKERADIQLKGGMKVRCEYEKDSGTWDIQLSPLD